MKLYLSRGEFLTETDGILHSGQNIFPETSCLSAIIKPLAVYFCFFWLVVNQLLHLASRKIFLSKIKPKILAVKIRLI
jgi:hypothetical protein